MVNRMAYAVIRSLAKQPATGWLHSPWHWYRYPFSLRGQVMWSEPLGAWFCPEDESAIECMLHLQSYEPTDWVSPAPGDVIVDVGAYIGWYSLKAARRAGPQGRVLALEPDPTNRRQLEKNLALNGIENCTIIPCAAWSRPGRIGWHRGDQPVWHGVDESQSKELIEAVTVDGLVSEHGLNRVDWIKMDIEGGETEAIKGSVKTLERFRPSFFIEVHETTAAIRSLLDSLNYDVKQEAYDEPPDRHGWMQARPR